MTFKDLGIIVMTVGLISIGQLMLKLGADQPRLVEALSKSVWSAAFSAATSPFILAGLAIYGVSVALWIWVLSKFELSLAYPFIGASFIITMAFGVYLLDEGVTPMRAAGTVLIALGCVLVGRTG